MARLISTIKMRWHDASTLGRVRLCCVVAATTLIVLAALFFTARLWLPPVVCLALAVWAIVDKSRQVTQRQQVEQIAAFQQSQREAAEFVQWLFCKQQRDILGIQAVPLVASLAYLARHIESEQTQAGLVHTLTIGLQSFNSQSFYLLWESLREPINEALLNYCSLKNILLADGSARFTVKSVDILDGAVLPQIVLKITDRNFAPLRQCNLISQEDADLWL
ncbi:hypothetical protein [Gemmiger sp. An194]|uniref:hypothetical protein n=1 Tax=Gemmiger sp. An194 TaxID=1965582 RepID=UPI000B385EBF|nr:hypothetical protein [Gemmiger sp. An194]OUP21755.1 hypothetical protein B5F28_14030 [Gemmiger sp. An194]